MFKRGSDGYSGADGGGYRGAGCDEYTSAPEVAPVLPSSGLEEPEQEWITRTESDELRLILATPDLAPGTRRFAMVLTDGSGIVAFPVVQVASYKYPDGSDATADREGPLETVLARYFGFPYGTRGIHVTELTFDEVWFVGRRSECSAAGWERGDDRGFDGGSRDYDVGGCWRSAAACGQPYAGGC